MKLKDFPAKIERVNVLAGSDSSGLLSFENSSFAFSYSPQGVPVSVTMPNRTASYNSGALHPIFEMNLPEGFVRQAISERLVRYTKVNDLLFLALQQNRGIGRLSYSSELAIEPPSAENLEALIHWDNSESVFEYLLDKFLLHTAVSGVQPKVMVPTDRATLLQPDLIVKTGGDGFPNLTLNEFVCMSIAKACGIATPEFWLSDNEELFIMKRFDIASNGSPLGMEDFAVIMKKSSTEKYRSSYESVAKVIDLYCSDPDQKQIIFDYIAISCLLGNGDAHLKNFALLYTDTNDDDLRLSPLYDVVNSLPYPELSNDLALSMNKSKAFPDKNGLLKFARNIGLRKQTDRLNEMADIAMQFIQCFERWDSFPELKKSLEKSISQTMIESSSGLKLPRRSPKKRKADRLLI
ncbi:MAG: type II toxin-antitoxin system HipA family toxin [Xanthomonadales bacterium]|nr:type II toxin-antitoxin system HipA family toxin [Xanthomonadales bacterium]